MRNLAAIVALLGVGIVAACSGSGGAAPARCSSAGAENCVGGKTVEACVTTTAEGACASTYYRVGSQTFECSSCTDTACAEKAAAACEGSTVTGVPAGNGTTGNGTNSPLPQGQPSQGQGTGAACQTSSDCPALPCGCSNGTTTSYQGCNNGFCAAECPSNNQPGGGACVVPGGCFCASGVCGFGSQTCCAAPGATGTGSACGTDCDCASGSCVTGQCF